MSSFMEIIAKASQSKVLVVGSSNTDMVVKVPRLPEPGETVLGGRFLMVQGGKGANQAVAAARLGARVSFLARLGTDVFGDTTRTSLANEGIDTQFIVRDADEPSGVALIFVDEVGENEIAVAPGANARLSPEDVRQVQGHIAEYASLVLQLEIPMDTVVSAARMASEAGVCVILNTAPMPPDGIPQELLKRVDVIVPNETETRLLLSLASGVEVAEDHALQLLNLGVRSAVVTAGAKGAFVATSGSVVHIPAPRVTAVDTTAAGDAFTGALAVALSSGARLEDSARFAAAVAAFSVTRMGAQSSLPTSEELAQFLAEL